MRGFAMDIRSIAKPLVLALFSYFQAAVLMAG
jgi:hypothetical protein